MNPLLVIFGIILIGAIVLIVLYVTDKPEPPPEPVEPEKPPKQEKHVHFSEPEAEVIATETQAFAQTLSPEPEFQRKAPDSDRPKTIECDFKIPMFDSFAGIQRGGNRHSGNQQAKFYDSFIGINRSGGHQQDNFTENESINEDTQGMYNRGGGYQQGMTFQPRQTLFQRMNGISPHHVDAKSSNQSQPSQSFTPMGRH